MLAQLNLPALKSKFTIQNVPIKWEKKNPNYTDEQDLQYKMFLLNLCFSDRRLDFLFYLQYKMFLLNRLCGLIFKYAIQNLQYKMFLLNNYNIIYTLLFALIYNTKCSY